MKRQINRLSKALYLGGYWYFVTICTENKSNIFVAEGLSLQENKFKLNSLGKMVEQEILNLENKFRKTKVENYIIMPNHIHLIISIDENATRIDSKKIISLGDVIGLLKAYSQKRIRDLLNANGGINPPLRNTGNLNYYKIWQKSFYDHIIRNETNLLKIQNYITNNLINWQLDSLHPDNWPK
jgi:putative transposase